MRPQNPWAVVRTDSQNPTRSHPHRSRRDQ
jgi:hypothetical protein